jgi:hypothetical protein
LLPTCESRPGTGVTSLQLRGRYDGKTNQERAIAEIAARGKINRLHQDRWRRLCAEDDPMESISADLSTILDRILDTAADNLRIAKILVQIGLDPNNITYDALFNRLLEIVLANITLANMFALVGAIFLVATLLMHTIVPLRVANMVGCMFFVAYGALSGNVGAFFPYGQKIETAQRRQRSNIFGLGPVLHNKLAVDA